MSSSIPCKYFLRNECRFGDNCRFYHPRGGSTMGNQSVGFGNRNFGVSNYNQQEVTNLSQKSQQNMDAMAEMVKKDMIEWDLGKIWPFSSYGPAGSKPSLPGFEDISQEELRYQFLQNNKMPPDLSLQMTAFQQARVNYQQSTPAVRNILERVIVKGEKISESNPSASRPSSGQSIFGGGATFGSSSLQNITTGFQANSSGPSGGFGVNNSAFSFSNSANVQQNQPNIDGMESTEVNSIFSQPQQQNSGGLFSSQATPASQGFGAFSFGQAFGSSQTQQPPLFVQPQQQTQQFFQPQQLPAFGQTQQQAGGIFQAANQQNQATPFQPSQLQSLLQTQQPPNAFQSIPNQQTTQQQPIALNKPFSFSSGDSIVPATSSSPSIFGGAFSQPAAMSQTNSIFGAHPLQTVGNSTGTAVSSSPTVFGGTFSQPTGIQPSNSIFGAPPNQTSTSIFGQQQTHSMLPTSLATTASVPVDHKYAYSEESDLTPDEIEAFKADHFTLETIPIRPPPKAYCGM